MLPTSYFLLPTSYFATCYLLQVCALWGLTQEPKYRVVVAETSGAVERLVELLKKNVGVQTLTPHACASPPCALACAFLLCVHALMYTLTEACALQLLHFSYVHAFMYALTDMRRVHCVCCRWVRLRALQPPHWSGLRRFVTTPVML